MVQSCPHSIYFFRGNVDTLDIEEATNTFADWHLVPIGRPVIAPPEQKLQTIDIPGTNGILDLSNSLTKYPVFNNRTGSMKFAVLHEYIDTPTVYTKIMRFLQGVNVKMILEDDPEYFYEGRVYVDSVDAKYDGTWTEIDLGYDLYPYRKNIHYSVDAWLWDPFNFETDVIQDTIFNALEIGSSGFVSLTPVGTENPKTSGWYEKAFDGYVRTNDTTVNPAKTYYATSSWTEMDFTGLIDSMPVNPEFTVDTVNNQPMQVQLYNTDLYGTNWVNFSIPEGTHGGPYDSSLYKLVFCEMTPESEVRMRFKNPGTVTIRFRSGRL